MSWLGPTALADCDYNLCPNLRGLSWLGFCAWVSCLGCTRLSWLGGGGAADMGALLDDGC